MDYDDKDNDSVVSESGKYFLNILITGFFQFKVSTNVQFYPISIYSIYWDLTVQLNLIGPTDLIWLSWTLSWALWKCGKGYQVEELYGQSIRPASNWFIQPVHPTKLTCLKRSWTHFTKSVQVDIVRERTKPIKINKTLCMTNECVVLMVF